MSRRQAIAEIVLIFAVFCVQGARPVPDVNEPYYLGKAIHFWNPDWLRSDFFMESADSHQVFDVTFGWLSLWLSPTALAWTGRVLGWLLLAWAWRRLSVAIVPRRWCSVLTAALFVCLTDRCQMAGEWVVGGIEAKVFAYVLAFLGIEALVRNRWNRALALFGAAAAFHVLVGGWCAVAAGIAWLRLAFFRQPSAFLRSTVAKGPPLRALWPGVVLGSLLALPGLWPSLTLDWNANCETVCAAHQIYVFERLPHHLLLTGIRTEFVLRLAVLWGFWVFLARCRTQAFWRRRTRLRAFVAGAVAIAFVGAAIHLLIPFDRGLAADLLRYYWFRLTDVALPLGVALETVAILAPAVLRATNARRRAASVALSLLILAAAWHVGDCLLDRVAPGPPRSHRAPPTVASSRQTADFEDWRAACRWVERSGLIPRNARFFVPRLSQTFGWYAGRCNVAVWKEVPQDAANMVEWRRRIREIYMTGQADRCRRWYDSLAGLGEERIRQLGAAYHADYILTERTDPMLAFPVVFGNHGYVIYRIQ